MEGTFDLPGIIPPLKIRHHLLLNWEGLRNLTLQKTAESGILKRSVTTRFEIRTPRRGIYRIRQSLLVTDIMELFQFRCPVNEKETLSVMPAPEGETWRAPRPSRFSSLSNRKKESAEEFYETRKYYPGDDPRKINWKLFAHSRELFIRVGEEGIPRLDRIFCLLLTGTTDKPLTTGQGDRIVRRFLHEVTLLLKNSEAEVLILAPGLPGYLPVNDPDHAARILAGISPINQWQLPDPVPEKGAWSIVTPAGVPELPDWILRARDRGIRPSLLLWDDTTLAVPLKTRVTSLFLKPHETDSWHERRLRKIQRPPLWLEMERLGNIPGGGIHVRTR